LDIHTTTFLSVNFVSVVGVSGEAPAENALSRSTLPHKYSDFACRLQNLFI
jgi:hypothetical protein